MRTLFILLLAIFISSASYAKYEPKRLYELAVKADKIVYGEIVSVDSLTFCLDIEGSITWDNGFLTVYKFRNWTCACRWTEYKVGQRVLLFLKYYKGKLRVMGSGNEGELPLVDSKVYISQIAIPTYGNIPPPPPPLSGLILKTKYPIGGYNAFPVTCYHLYNGNFFGYSMGLRQFLRDIVNIRACFDFKYKPWWRIIDVKIYWSDELIKSKKEKSNLFRWTYDELSNKKAAS